MTAIAPAVKRLDRDAEAGIMRRLFGAHEFGVLVATAAIFLYCALFVNNFLTSQNLLSVAQQIAFIGIIGTGMTLVVVVGEIDLSVGSQYGLLSVVMAYSLTEWSMPAYEAAVVVIALGACIGLVQGLVTTVFKVPSFVVTLAGLAILRGFALLLTASEPIVAPVSKQYHSLVGGSAVGSLAMQTVWMGGIMLAFGWMLSRTKFGYDVYATGGNMKAAVDAADPREPDQGCVLRPDRRTVRPGGRPPRGLARQRQPADRERLRTERHRRGRRRRGEPQRRRGQRDRDAVRRAGRWPHRQCPGAARSRRQLAAGGHRRADSRRGTGQPAGRDASDGDALTAPPPHRHTCERVGTESGHSDADTMLHLSIHPLHQFCPLAGTDVSQ